MKEENDRRFKGAALLRLLRMAASKPSTLWIDLRRRYRLIHSQIPGQKSLLKEMDVFRKALEMRLVSDGDPFVDPPNGSMEDKDLLRQIREETRQSTRNNLTRTEAYFAIYKSCQELHWALLAHLVSRNGGYNMTDLHRRAVKAVTSEADRLAFFSFLERCNDVIFRDAYPQLRLYQLGLQRKRSYLHLLPHFQVSRFMQVAWQLFQNGMDNRLLTVALIINEQMRIEAAMVDHESVIRRVFATPAFSAQSLMHVSAVLFAARDLRGRQHGLYGNFVRDFTSVTERIEAGKSLYALLFANQDQPRTAFLRAAESVPHTASREDILPQVFTHEATSRGLVYSPRLVDVWPDVLTWPIAVKEWCEDLSALDYLFPAPTVRMRDFSKRYIRQLRRLEHFASVIQSKP